MSVVLKMGTESAQELAKRMAYYGDLQRFAVQITKSIQAGNTEHTIRVPNNVIADYTFLSNTLLPYGWTFQQKGTNKNGPIVDIQQE